MDEFVLEKCSSVGCKLNALAWKVHCGTHGEDNPYIAPKQKS
tara:strand:- start:373 stop:498 length:126 start_codon:yes stop_codon:yes gene_type:complete